MLGIYNCATTFGNLFPKLASNERVLGCGQCQKRIILLVDWKGQFPHVLYSISRYLLSLKFINSMP